MAKKRGTPNPDYRPPAHNPHYGHESYGSPPPYSEHYPPQSHQNYSQPPAANHGGGRGGGGGSGSNRQHVRHQPRRHSPSEVSDCVKYSLFLYNCIFWVVGLFFIAAGVWAFHDRGVFNEVQSLSNQNISFLTDPVVWLFVLGAVVFILGTMGCLGALRENICMLNTFRISMGVILLLEIGGGFAIYFYREQIQSKFAGVLTEVTIRDYRDNADFQDLIDAFQTGLSCCGVNSYDDWDANIYFNCTGPTTNPERCGVPFSCCLPDSSGVANTQCGYGVRSPSQQSSLSSKIYITGCADAFTIWINRYLYYIAAIAGVIILVEMFGFCFAQSLINDIKRQMSRWGHR